MKRLMLNLIVGLVFCFSTQAMGQTEVYTLVIKDHTFTPSEIKIPANQKVTLIVDNQDPTPEEFESKTLRREKVIAGNSKGTISIGPLKVGTYPFVGEFHEDKAKGIIIAE